MAGPGHAGSRITGYQEIIIEQGRKLHLDHLAVYFDKVLIAAGQLSELVDRLLDPQTAALPEAERDLADSQAKLRHDLRTPLNAIIGYSEMALEDLEDTGAVRRRRCAPTSPSCSPRRAVSSTASTPLSTSASRMARAPTRMSTPTPSWPDCSARSAQPGCEPHHRGRPHPRRRRQRIQSRPSPAPAGPRGPRRGLGRIRAEGAGSVGRGEFRPHLPRPAHARDERH